MAVDINLIPCKESVDLMSILDDLQVRIDRMGPGKIRKIFYDIFPF